MLVCTLYDVTHWVVSSARPCVTTLLTVYAEPSAIVMYWPTAFVSADHAWAESSIERAKPVPGASLFQTLEYDRALSAGLNDTPAKAGAYTYAMGESRGPSRLGKLLCAVHLTAWASCAPAGCAEHGMPTKTKSTGTNRNPMLRGFFGAQTSMCGQCLTS